ncbi:MAG: hypothetical protein K0Q74_724 [Gammaproteobacteria bacterium]|jgi:hypothetical protein|nr:hypothetical protein [Gammaproteobacteria bacterium]
MKILNDKELTLISGSGGDSHLLLSGSENILNHQVRIDGGSAEGGGLDAYNGLMNAAANGGLVYTKIEPTTPNSKIFDFVITTK